MNMERPLTHVMSAVDRWATRSKQFRAGHRVHIRLFVLLVLGSSWPCMCLGREAVATEQEDHHHDHRLHTHMDGPYCGLYCVYVLLRANDRSTEFGSLLKPEYISSRKGATFAQLKKALEDHGLHATLAARLTSSELRRLPYPIILHTKPIEGQEGHDHFELFVGTHDGQARMIDPPGPAQLVSFPELVSRWDGKGLIVSVSGVDTSQIFRTAHRRSLMCVLLAGVIIFLAHLARRWLSLPTRPMSRTPVLTRSAMQAAVLAMTALSGTMVYHFAHPDGFLARAEATASVRRAHMASFIPKISERKVRRLLDSDAIFVDARLPRDYETGHIEDAVSIPVDVNDIKRREAMVAIGKDRQVVVYCQSTGCKFAERVAVKLATDGFSNVSIFRGGWNSWAAKHQLSAAKNEGFVGSRSLER